VPPLGEATWPSEDASRREAAAARATKSGELPKSAAISWKDVAATARSGELSKAVAGAELSIPAVHPRGMDGAHRSPEDRQVLLPHVLLR